MTLVGHWPLDEDSGTTTFDHSGHGNDGSISGASVGVTGPLGATGYSFDGVDDIVSVPDNPSLDITPAITITAWVNPAVYGSDRGTICTKNTSYYCQVRSTGVVSVYTYYNNNGSKGSSTYMDSNSTVPKNTWTHIAFVEESDGTRYIYINGELDKTGSYEASIWTDTNNLTIGAQSGSNRLFEGDIANVRVYNHPLTPAEIQYLYSVSQHATRMTSPQHR